MKLESKNTKSAIDPYKASDSREEEEENDEDNSLEGYEAIPPHNSIPPKGLPWIPKITEGGSRCSPSLPAANS